MSSSVCLTLCTGVFMSFRCLLYLSVLLSVCPSAHLRAQSYAERLRLGLAVMHGEASQYDSEMVDGPQSPPLSRPATGHTGLELPCKTSCLCLISDSHRCLSQHPFCLTDSDYTTHICFLPLVLWSSSHCVSSSSSCQPSVFSPAGAASSHPSCPARSLSDFTQMSVYCYRWTSSYSAQLFLLDCGNFWSPL